MDNRIKEQIYKSESRLTIVSRMFNTVYSYKILRAIEDNCTEVRYKVYLLYGPHNTDRIKFIGWFYEGDSYLYHPVHMTYLEDALYFRCFAMLLRNLDGDMPDDVSVYIDDRSYVRTE